MSKKVDCMYQIDCFDLCVTLHSDLHGSMQVTYIVFLTIFSI